MEENTIIKDLILMFRNRMVRAFVLVIFLILVGIAFYFYNQYQSTKSLLQNPSGASNAIDTAAIIAQVGKLIELPNNEVPKVAIVNDKTQLPNVPIFSNAQNGDEVLLYQNAKKGILYRPSTNKIIEVSPINFVTENQQDTPQTQATASPSADISLTPTKAIFPTAKLTPTPTQ